MSRAIGTLLGAISVSLLATFFAPASFAQMTTVLCVSPQVQITTGLDGTAARIVINCSGGSSAAGIPFFAFRISDDPTVVAFLPPAIGSYVLLYGAMAKLQILTDLSDTSGDAWGCSATNCRRIYSVQGE
jgi:hypothetical protein